MILRSVFSLRCTRRIDGLINCLKPSHTTAILKCNKQSFSSKADEDDEIFSLSNLPQGAALLGFSGAIPFVSMAAASCFTHPYMELLALGQVSYAACILTFLGGVHWGKELVLNQNQPDTKTLAYSVLPALCSWSAFTMPTSVALYYLAGGLLCISVIDTRDRSLPLWYRQMRVPLTFLASTSVFITGANLTGNFLY